MLVGMNAVPIGGRGARALADGNEMPVLGLGVWQVPAGASELLVVAEQHRVRPAGGSARVPAAATDLAHPAAAM
jgi:hypothetical protein